MKNFIYLLLSMFSIVANIDVFGTTTATTTTGTNTYLSALDLTQLDYRRKVMKPYGNQFSQFAMTIHDLGYTGTTANQLKTVFNEDYLHETFINKTISSAGAANAAVTLTLDATAVDSTRGYYPRVNDELRFKNGTVGVITATGGTTAAPTFTIYPKTLGDNIPAVAALEEITILSNSFAQGTEQPDARRGSTFKETFTMKISKETSEITNSAEAEKTWFEDEYGNIGTKGSVDAEMRLMNAISGALLFDVPKTNSNLVSNPISSVVGLKSYINTGGNVVNYTAGLFNDTIFDAIISKMEKNNGEEENLVFAGAELYGEIENKYFAPLSVANSEPFLNGGQTISTKSGIVSGKEINMTFVSLMKRGYKFQFIKHKEMANPKMHNLSGYKDNYNAFIIPNGVTRRKSENGTYETAPYIEVLYKAHNGHNRKFVIQKRGGMAPNLNQMGQDITKYEALAEYMAVYTCKNKFAYINAL